jgi:penicillin-binding protein 2
MKPLVYVAAVTEGEVGVYQPITCEGHLDPDAPGRYRCWIYKHYDTTHGPMAADAALQQSCNIFFYTLGRRMGRDKLVTWYERFGLGRFPGSGLADEVSGSLPQRLGEGRKAPPNHAILMGIGQGPMTLTPLQAAAAYATLARGGQYISPTFILDPPLKQTRYDLRLNQQAVRVALDGLHKGVNTRNGTSHHFPGTREAVFNIDGVKLMGKSGTATASPLWIDADDDGEVGEGEIARKGDHAWFVGLAQKPGSIRPDYVITVVVEYGGSGGAIAGPIANQVLHAMRAEGYL